MIKKKTQLEYRPKKSPVWERAVNAILGSSLDFTFFGKDREMYIAIGDPSWDSIILKSDGTWHLG